MHKDVISLSFSLLVALLALLTLFSCIQVTSTPFFSLVPSVLLEIALC